MHVDETYFGTVYTSDDRGILYSKSLERHLFGSQRKSDFTNVTSLRGVYLTNVFQEGMTHNHALCLLRYVLNAAGLRATHGVEMNLKYL